MQAIGATIGAKERFPILKKQQHSIEQAPTLPLCPTGHTMHVNPRICFLLVMFGLWQPCIMLSAVHFPTHQGGANLLKPIILNALQCGLLSNRCK